MEEYRTMTVQCRFGERPWVAWIGRDYCTFDFDCCAEQHATMDEAAEHGASILAAEAKRAWREAALIEGTWAQEALRAAA